MKKGVLAILFVLSFLVFVSCPTKKEYKESDGSVCGDGIKASSEECEQQSDCSEGFECDGCQCVPLTCGNGNLDEGEECEEDLDCEWTQGESCVKCKCKKDEEDVSFCGDGVLDKDEGEECEGNRASMDPNLFTCGKDEECVDCKCLHSTCGNGSIENKEECESDLDCKDNPFGETVCVNCKCFTPENDEDLSDNDNDEYDFDQKQDNETVDTEQPDDSTETKECKCSEGTLEVVSGCDGWEDSQECTGFHSVVCENDPHKSKDYCDLSSGPEAAMEKFEDVVWNDGQQFTGFGCTIKIKC
jgi:hypothetical protein